MDLIGRVSLTWLLLASRDHVAAHVQSVVVGSILGRAYALVRRVWLRQVAIFHSFFGVDGDRSWLRGLLDGISSTVEALVKNFTLMAEVTRAWLISLRRLRVVAIVATILANFVNLWLVQALESKIDTLEINKRPGGGAPRSAHIHLVFQFSFLIMKKLHYLWCKTK